MVTAVASVPGVFPDTPRALVACNKAAKERLEYQISWRGLIVGTAVVANETKTGEGSNQVVRSIHVVSRPWLKWFYPVQDEIECVLQEQGAQSSYSVRKRINEAGFHQDDVLTVNGATGIATWSDRLCGRNARYPVPSQVRDYLTFLFDLRFANFPLGVHKEYQLVMDDGVRRLSVAGACTGVVECAWGKVAARRLEIKSLSSQLFVRNVPRAVWISEEHPVMIVMEASSKLGIVRAVLQKWDVDGRPFDWKLTPP